MDEIFINGSGVDLGFDDKIEEYDAKWKLVCMINVNTAFMALATVVGGLLCMNPCPAEEEQ